MSINNVSEANATTLLRWLREATFYTLTNDLKETQAVIESCFVVASLQ